MEFWAKLLTHPVEFGSGTAGYLVRTFVLGFALLASATGADAADWKKLGESPTVGILLADMDTVERTGDTVAAWLKYPNYKSDVDSRVASASVRTKFYCSAGEFEMFKMLVRDKDGKVLYDVMDQHGRNRVQSGTVFGSASKTLCSLTTSR